MAHRDASSSRSRRGKAPPRANRVPHDDEPVADTASPYAELVQTRVSRAAKEQIDNLRAVTGMSQAQWVRAVLYKELGLAPPAPPPVLGEPPDSKE